MPETKRLKGNEDAGATQRKVPSQNWNSSPLFCALVTVKIINVQVPVLTVDCFKADSPLPPVVLEPNTLHTHFTATVCFLCYIVASVQTAFATVPVVASRSIAASLDSC